jgi:phytoene synthase
LFALDDAMGDVVARATEPALAAIKLAWWRDRLAELDQGTVPAEPRLQVAARELLSRGIPGISLAGLEVGWSTLLDEQADADLIAKRGARLFAVASSLLGASDPLVGAAGRVFGWQTASRLGVAGLSLPEVDVQALAGHRFARRLRPLMGLAALAVRDARRTPECEPEATPGRALALIRHRLTGRVA